MASVTIKKLNAKSEAFDTIWSSGLYWRNMSARRVSDPVDIVCMSRDYKETMVTMGLKFSILGQKFAPKAVKPVVGCSNG